MPEKKLIAILFFQINLKLFLIIYGALILICFFCLRNYFGTSTFLQYSLLNGPFPVVELFINVSVKFYDEWYSNKSHYAKDYVFPEKITTLNYVESPCSLHESPFILIIVCSNLENRELRQSIRDTWASNAKKYNIHVFFLVGKSINPEVDVRF